MAANTAEAAALVQAQRTIIARGRMTEKNVRPTFELFETFNHQDGSRQLDIPKYNEFLAYDVTAGIGVTRSEQIVPTYVSVNLKRIYTRVILLKDLIQQMSDDVKARTGEIAGEAMGTKRDKDAIALFATLTTVLGADNISMKLTNVNGAIGYAISGDVDADGRSFGPLPSVSIVHHGNAIGYLRNTLAITGATYPIPTSINNWALLRDYWAGFNISNVQVYQDNNIAKIAAIDSGYGAIFARKGLGRYMGPSEQPHTEYDSDLFAWKTTWSERYKTFITDQKRAAALQFEMVTMPTNS